MKKSEIRTMIVEELEILNESEIDQAKAALKRFSKGKALVRDISDDTIAIATGGKYSVKVKILGFDK